MTSPRRRFPISFQVGDLLPGDPNYMIQSRDHATTGKAKPIGSGGAGVVFRAAYKGGMERAVKFLSPMEALTHVDTEVFEQTFMREIGVLLNLTHTHLTKITDYGVHEVDGRSVLYFAMDYIDGQSLKDLVEADALTPADFLEVVAQVLGALEYLHARGVMHCDVKLANILVRNVGQREVEATLADLGVAKVLRLGDDRDLPSGRTLAADVHRRLFRPGGDTDPVSDNDNTYFVSTERIVRGIWQGRLQRLITSNELAEMFPSHELYTIGVLIDEVLDAGSMRSRIATGGESTLSAIELMRDRLRTKEPEDDYYHSISEVRQDWAKLRPGYLSPLSVPELAVANWSTSVSTPTGRVGLTSRIEPLVNHPLFQRLHEIPQLEFVHLVSPGARHSRFMHSMRVYSLTLRYVTHLLGDVKFRLSVEPSDIEALLLRALLHDIGHYPLSHMFEDFSYEQRDAGTPTIPTDDDLFWEFVGAGEGRASRAFAQYSPIIDAALARLTKGKTRPLRDELPDRFSSDALRAIDGLENPMTESHAMLAGLLNSPVDADKVAYLSDDSLMTGVRYGHGIDIDGLLVGLRAPEPDDLQSGGRLRATVGLRDKALTAAESIVMARYWMFKRVYWHHTSRAVTAMVKYALGELLQPPGWLSMEEYIERTMFWSPAEAIRLLHDRFAGLPEIGERPRRNPVAGLIGGQREPYKRLLTLSADADDHLHYQLMRRHAHASLSTFAGELSAAIEHEFPEVQPRPGDVIIDVPVRRREDLGGRAIVYFDRSSRPGRLLTGDPTLSPLLAGWKDEWELHVKKSRVYLHPDLARAFEPAQSRRLQDVLRERLEDLLGV